MHCVLLTVKALDAKGSFKREYKPQTGSTAEGVAVTSQFVFVAQHGQPISRFNRDTGKLIDTIGKVGGQAGELGCPRSLAVDEARDWLFVSDWNRNRVLRFVASTGKFDTEFGSAGNGGGQLSNPIGIRLCGDSLWIADYSNKR